MNTNNLKDTNTRRTGEIGYTDRRLADLSALHVSPHGSLATDGEPAPVENGQDEDGQSHEQEGQHSQHDARGRLAGRRFKKKISTHHHWIVECLFLVGINDPEREGLR